MKILSHRGYWKQETEKNLVVAFERSFQLGFGTETDVRDRAGELVICHDLPAGGELTFREFLKLYTQFKNNLPLAINVKSDGLQSKMGVLLKEFNVTDYFLFDMSIPDTLRSLNAQLKCFARISEYENPTEELLKSVSGVWYDYFHPRSIDTKEVQHLLDKGLAVCLISPELHHREPLEFWKQIKVSRLHENAKLMICTDVPEEFKKMIFA